MSTNPLPAPPPAFAPYAPPPITIILTVVLLVFFFIGFFSIYFCRCFMQNLLYTWHLRHSPTGTPVGAAGGGLPPGLDPSIINSFPTFTYSSVKEFRREKYGLECAICLCEFEDENILRLLTKCYHVFHQECIDLWLESHKSCPFCRRGLETPINSPAKSPFSLNSASMHEIREDESLEDTFSINIKDEDINENNEKDNENNNKEHVAIVVNQEEEEGKVGERFPRSNSTGHSIARNKGGGDEDKFTLRLPEHVQAKLFRGHNWTRSCTTFGEYTSKTSTGSTGFGEVSTVADVAKV